MRPALSPCSAEWRSPPTAGGAACVSFAGEEWFYVTSATRIDTFEAWDQKGLGGRSERPHTLPPAMTSRPRRDLHEPTRQFRRTLLEALALTRVAFGRRHLSGLSPATLQTLLVLHERGGMTEAALASETRLDASTVSRAVSALVHRGWAETEYGRRSTCTAQLTKLGGREAEKLVWKMFADYRGFPPPTRMR